MKRLSKLKQLGWSIEIESGYENNSRYIDVYAKPRWVDINIRLSVYYSNTNGRYIGFDDFGNKYYSVSRALKGFYAMILKESRTYDFEMYKACCHHAISSWEGEDIWEQKDGVTTLLDGYENWLKYKQNENNS